MTKKASKPIVTERSIYDYIPDDHNANAGTERGLQMVEDSLREDGVGRSIVVDAKGKIPAGNKTLQAAVNAGIEKVIEIETDGHALIVHKRTDWDLDDDLGSARRYATRDNLSSDVGLSWDANEIARLNSVGADLKMFYDWELDKMTGIIPAANADPANLWGGMPEFNQPDGRPFRTFICHFNSQEEVDKFIKVTGQKITDQTKSLHFPPLDPKTLKWGEVVEDDEP